VFWLADRLSRHGDRRVVGAGYTLSDGNFRDVVLGLLFLSGVGLVWSNIAPS
jgi:hypothetical protein